MTLFYVALANVYGKRECVEPAIFCVSTHRATVESFAQTRNVPLYWCAAEAASDALAEIFDAVAGETLDSYSNNCNPVLCADGLYRDAKIAKMIGAV